MVSARCFAVVNQFLVHFQGSSQGSSGSSSCYRPVIDEDRLQDHACTLFEKVCIDQVGCTALVMCIKLIGLGAPF